MTLCPIWLDEDTSKKTDPFGYCGMTAKDLTCHRNDSTCRALGAGCGVSLYDVTGRDDSGHCDEKDIREGRCTACQQLAWCDDSLTAEEWMDSYYGSDFIRARGNIGRGTRQCKFKGAQKESWLAAMRARYETRRRNGDDGAWQWNEVNFYTDPEDDLKHILWKNLIGFVVFRNLDRDEGNEEFEDSYPRRVQKLAAHLRALPGGKDVPIFAMSVQQMHGTWTNVEPEWWEPTRSIDLTAPPFNLEHVPPLEFAPPPLTSPPATPSPEICRHWCHENTKSWSHKCAHFVHCAVCVPCHNATRPNETARAGVVFGSRVGIGVGPAGG